jgi:hypothetical protein
MLSDKLHICMVTIIIVDKHILSTIIGIKL